MTQESFDPKEAEIAQTLQTWDDAYIRMYDAVPKEEREAAIRLSMELKDSEQLASVVDAQEEHLSPQTLYFLRMSVAAKQLKNKE